MVNELKINRTFREIAIIVVMTIIVTIIAKISGGIQMFCEWFQAHEVVHAPIFGFLVLMSGLAIYGLRSYNETDQEIGSYRDVKHSLQESEEKFRTIFDKANDGIYLIDLHGRFIDVNAIACKQTGYSRDEMLQMTYKDMGFPEIDYKKQVKELYKKGYTSFESASILKNGSNAYGQIRSQIIQYGGKTAILSIARDITERKKAETDLQESERKFRTIFENANDGISIAGIEGHFWDVNQKFCELLGYSRDELLQMKMWDLEPHEQIEESLERMKELRKQGYAIFETVGVCKGGSTIPIELSIRIIKYEEKPALLCVVRDITERKKTEKAIINAKITAENANRVKTEFITNMSHELRTPLNSIIGFSDILLNENSGPLNEKQKRYISNAHKSGKHLLNLINDILSISNIESGKMDLHINEFFVSDAIDEVEALMMPIASEKEIDLTCNIDIEVPTIKADMIKFKQILYNLVSNAIKFTDQGGSVTIGGKISEDFVHISVKDTGIGISPEDRDKLFKPFFQVDSSTAREYGGTGLGLALVKKFVEMHGGEVWVESNVGEGSTFTFSIPINQGISEV
ncbi:PAS domain S-box protein [Methanococcoides sp. AM1]|uniref:PAS domain S-box protein n=1 Tax=Methanococcoides sp. AM1 TaxID=1201011 RepID=UPI001083CC42|nr:PAS domain S-box protein [Methanococcoides sp. AM1]